MIVIVAPWRRVSTLAVVLKAYRVLIVLITAWWQNSQAKGERVATNHTLTSKKKKTVTWMTNIQKLRVRTVQRLSWPSIFDRGIISIRVIMSAHGELSLREESLHRRTQTKMTMRWPTKRKNLSSRQCRLMSLPTIFSTRIVSMMKMKFWLNNQKIWFIRSLYSKMLKWRIALLLRKIQSIQVIKSR